MDGQWTDSTGTRPSGEFLCRKGSHPLPERTMCARDPCPRAVAWAYSGSHEPTARAPCIALCNAATPATQLLGLEMKATLGSDNQTASEGWS